MHDIIAPAGLARAEVIEGLRQVADYLDQHPDIPVNEYGWTLLDFTSHDEDTAGQPEIDQVADILGVTVRDDTADGGHYRAVKSFGRITYEFVHATQRGQAAHRALMSYSGAVTPDDTPEAA